MKNLRLEVKNGIYLFIVMGVYFLAIEALGLAESSTLRYVNALLVLYFMNRSVVQRINRKDYGMLKYFGSSIATGITGITISVFALYGYISIFHEAAYLSSLSEPLIGANLDLRLEQYCFAIFAEGMASAVVIGLCLGQYWKNAELTEPQITII